MLVKYFDQTAMGAMDDAAFRAARPYPWVNPSGLLHGQAFEELRAKMPPVELFNSSFGKRRKHGQQSHDRYALTYHPDLPIDPAWHEFLAELGSPAYRDFLARMIGNSRFDLEFRWHYTPNGCSVSPHCDAYWKLGSHIFYFNTEDDWDPSWGGETVILDDHGRFGFRSAPSFDDFDEAQGSESLGNRSLLFIRNGHSWHGVREINCPEGALRKIFLVVIKQLSWPQQLRRLVA